MSPLQRTAALAQERLSPEQRAAFDELVGAGDLKALVGVAGTGKSRLLAAARLAWEGEGYTVKGAALSGIAAENLTLSSGIPSSTLAGLEYAWQFDRDPLTSRDVLVIDEAGMVGTRQLAHVLDTAAAAGAKVVLVGDPEQLQPIEAGAAFRGIIAEGGLAELTEVHRQRHAWQRQATQGLSSGATRQALAAYEDVGAILALPTHEAAREALLEQWAADAATAPHESRLMLAYTRDDVQALNGLARGLRRERGELGAEESIETARGPRAFAVNDRLYFLRNERSLGVKNGSLGTIEAIQGGVLQVRLDASDALIAVDTRFYHDLDHGYAATVHRSQGTTVDRSYVLASSHYDRHTTYVALSRHREAAMLYYSAEDFVPPWRQGQAPTPEEARTRWFEVLSRPRPKELAHDYLDMPLAAAAGNEHAHRPSLTMQDIDAQQQQAAERWRAMHHGRELGVAADLDPQLEIDPTYRPRHLRDLSPDHDLPSGRGHGHERQHLGPEDELEI